MGNLILWLGMGIVAAALLLAVWRFSKRKKADKVPRVAAPSPPPAGQNELQFSARPQSLPSGDNVHLQLEILRQTLDLTTAILLWAGPEDKNLQILSVASLRDDIVREPFPRGSGIIGGLRQGCPEIAVSPVPQHLSIPYYATDRKTGSLLALSIPNAVGPDGDGQNRSPATAILCLDRESEAPWTEQEREVVELTCRKLSHDLRFTHQMEETNRHMEAIHQICMSMLELNQVLGLQAVFAATIKTVKQLTAADFMAISLLEGGEHRIVMASGHKSGNFEDGYRLGQLNPGLGEGSNSGSGLGARRIPGGSTVVGRHLLAACFGEGVDLPAVGFLGADGSFIGQ